MTGEQIREYIENELGCDPVHDVDALACAIERVADDIDYDSFAIMQLILENKPIDALHTHSYGFHTANGREIINAIQNKYYEYESTN